MSFASEWELTVYAARGTREASPAWRATYWPKGRYEMLPRSERMLAERSVCRICEVSERFGRRKADEAIEDRARKQHERKVTVRAGTTSSESNLEEKESEEGSGFGQGE